jgi:hypothetical protein
MEDFKIGGLVTIREIFKSLDDKYQRKASFEERARLTR